MKRRRPQIERHRSWLRARLREAIAAAKVRGREAPVPFVLGWLTAEARLPDREVDSITDISRGVAS